MVVRISDKTQNYSKVTKLLVKPKFIDLTKCLLDRMVPEIANFKHRETPSDAAGHIKTSLAGTFLLFKIDEGKCLIGENKRIYFMEFDGPRSRKIQMVTLIK